MSANLYDTRADPEQREPVSDPERRAAMAARIAEWRQAPPAGLESRIELDDEMRQQLRALGYEP